MKTNTLCIITCRAENTRIWGTINWQSVFNKWVRHPNTMCSKKWLTEILYALEKIECGHCTWLLPFPQNGLVYRLTTGCNDILSFFHKQLILSNRNNYGSQGKYRICFPARTVLFFILPFRLWNASAPSQSKMYFILSPFNGHFVLVYLNHPFVFPGHRGTHIAVADRFFTTRTSIRDT